MGRHRKIEGLPSFHDFSSVSVECVGLGASASLGSLAVPSGWPTANTATQPVPSADEAMRTSRPQWLTYQDSLMGVMTGSRATFRHDEGNEQALGD